MYYNIQCDDMKPSENIRLGAKVQQNEESIVSEFLTIQKPLPQKLFELNPIKYKAHPVMPTQPLELKQRNYL